MVSHWLLKKRGGRGVAGSGVRVVGLHVTAAIIHFYIPEFLNLRHVSESSEGTGEIVLLRTIISRQKKKGKRAATKCKEGARPGWRERNPATSGTKHVLCDVAVQKDLARYVQPAETRQGIQRSSGQDCLDPKRGAALDLASELTDLLCCKHPPPNAHA